MSDERSIKVVLLGEAGVGKTNLIRVAMGKPFEKEENSTISSTFFENEVVLNNKKYSYCLWDTAGQEIYRSLNKIFMKESKIVIIVFSIDSRQSFDQIDFWLNYIKEILGNDNYIIGLVGNKSDLFLNQQISEKEMNKKVEELQVKFKITSAAIDKVGFKEFLEDLLKEYINKYSPQDIGKLDSFKITKEKDDNDEGDNKGNKRKKNCC